MKTEWVATGHFGVSSNYAADADAVNILREKEPPVFLIALLFVTFLPPQTSPLAFNTPIERAFRPAMTDSWSVKLEATEYFHLSIEQRGIDVEVTLSDPTGKEVRSINHATGTRGLEETHFIAEISGTYRIEVRGRDKYELNGGYSIHVEQPRVPTAKDRLQVAGHQAYLEGLELQAGQSLEKLNHSVLKFAEAASIFHAVENWRAEGSALSSEATSLASLSDFRRMLTTSEEALIAWRRGSDPRGESQALNAIAVSYYRLGDVVKALDYFGQALKLRREQGDRSGAAPTLGNIAMVFTRMGEYQQALDNLREALDLQRAIGDHRSEGPSLGQIAATYRAFGEFQTAIEYYEQALPLLSQRELRSDEATALAGMGAAYDALDQKEKALDFYDQSLKLVQKIGDRLSEAATLITMGRTNTSIGKFAQAHQEYDRAAEIMREVGDRGGEAKVLSGLGAVYLATGDYSSAIEISNRALNLAREVIDVDTENTALYSLARAYRSIGNLDEARDRIEESLRLVETTRAKVLSTDLRAAYFATVIKQYEFYIDLLVQLHSIHPSQGYDRAAFEASERAHARNLVDTLRVAQADTTHGVDPELLTQEKDRRRLVNEKAAEQTKLLSRTHTAAQADVVARELESLLSDYERIKDRVRSSNPKYADLTSSASLSLSEIQSSILDSNSVLLEFSLGDNRSFLWVVSTDRLLTFELPPRATIERTARAVYESWKRPGTSRDENKAALFSDLIFKNAYAAVRGKRLLIVADGVLHYIPFGALPVPGHATASVGPRLIAAHEVISLPSASTAAVLREETKFREKTTKAAAVFADPVFSADDLRVGKKIDGLGSSSTREVVERSAAEVGITSFERLWSSRTEANTIQSLFARGDTLAALDFNANREKVLTSRLEDYRILHFATHSLINSSHPELSGIVLSLVDANGEPQNGFLRMNEIYGLKLRSELVVLSACETALGKDVRGEGLIGLTRGFMYAGSPRVIASLWRVPDRATSELMKRFYEGLFRGGLPPAAALRAAQLDMRKTSRWSSPYYWAGFILQGEWQ